MAAIDGGEDVQWSSVVGEYGVLLTEMGSMEELSTPIKSYPRIKYTCMTASKKYVAMGSSTGGIYLFDRHTLKHSRFISSKDGPIHATCFTQQRNLLAAATSLGIVHVWEVSSRHREKPKLIRRSEEHKNTTVSALIWDSDEGRVFAGDMLGVVSVIHVPQSNKLSPSGNKGRPLLHTSSIVAKAHTAIVQLDCIGDKLLVSTLTKCAVVDLKSLNSVSVGMKPRDGLYGSCFLKESTSDSLTIYSARPGSRLWEASIDGQVVSTQQYKKLLGTPPVTILGYRCNAVKAVQQGDFPPQSVNFAKLLLVRERFIATWCGMCLYILDPILGQLVAWYSLDTEILDACCLGPEIYVYDLDGCVKWFGLLSVKECVARLNAMGEIKQCITVMLECKQYIIPGSARDLVPVSLVTNLRDGLHEEDNEDNKEIILRLEALENDLEPALEESCYPPSFYGNLGVPNSPDTLSACSEAFTDDLEGTASTSGTRIGEEEEEGGGECVHEGHKGISGEYGLSNVIKKRNISLEGILISAAAAAKKFAIERQKGVFNTKTSASPVSPRNEKNVTEKRDGASSVSDTGQQTKEVAIQEEESPILSKKSLEQSPYHSDDSESRMSGNEAGSYEEEAGDKKELVVFKDKRKRKKRVVTVDIDTPQVEEDVFLESPINHPRSSSFPSLSIEDTELKSRRTSEPITPLPSELPPAIPAILSKAKGLLKKKLKSPVDDHLPTVFPSYSPTPPPLEESLSESAKEDAVCPQEVEELIQYSAKTRNEVKNPAVLFSINSLCKTLEDWIPKLHAATKSCFELNATWKNSNAEIELKSFLNEDVFGNVSYLTQMCFDCGVYGLEGLKCVEDAQNVAENTNKLSPDLEIQYSKENGNVKDPSECELDDVTSDAAPEQIPKVSESGSTPLLVGVESIGVSRPTEVPSASENGLATKTDASTSRSTSSESEERKLELNGTMEDGGEVASAAPLSVSDRDIVRQQNCVTGTSASGSFPLNGEMPETATQVQSDTTRLQSVANCERICQHCENKTAFFKPSDEMEDHNENPTQQQVDSYRSRFLAYYFFLFDVKRLRRTLHFIKGDKWKTWRIFMDSLSGLVSVDDVIAKHTKEGDARRALHELYDGMNAYSETLLYHLSCLYEHDGGETMLTCARMFPDVKPWEVMKICRQSKVHSLESSAADFLYYAEKLMRWRAEVGNTKEQTVGKVCEDREVAIWWFHCALIANSTAPTEKLDCQLCGKPRPGSHTVAWQNADHLRLLLGYLCKKDPKELVKFMDMCWKHCYWSGLIRLCISANRRKEALRLLMCLGDLCLIKDPQTWGLLPKTLNEWKLLLELLLSRDHQDDESSHVCAPLASSDWSADLTWSNVTKLMLERLGAGHTVNLLQALSLDTPHLSGDFYYSCLLGAVIERRQRTLIHEMLKKLDSYLWSRRSGALAPKINNFRKEEELLGSKCKDDVKPQLDSLSQFRTLEDGASNWGQNIRLSDGECLVCSLKLCEQISTSSQGLVMFECGHVFHKHCVPEAACVLCFEANLTSIGTSMKL